MSTVAHAVGRLVAVFAIAAAGLRVADSVPRVVTGLPRGVSTARSLDELQARTGTRFPMPSYFPSHLQWPPSDFTFDGTGAAAVAARRRDTGERWLTITSVPAKGPVGPAAAWPGSSVLQESEASVGPWTARVQRLQDRGGALWHEAAWQDGDRLLSVRYRGSVEDLIRIAASLRPRSTS